MVNEPVHTSVGNLEDEVDQLALKAEALSISHSDIVSTNTDTNSKTAATETEVTEEIPSIATDDSIATPIIASYVPYFSNYMLVDTVQKVIDAIQLIRRYKFIAIDLEGIELCREGRISIVQITSRENFVYLFDITTLQESAFDNGLKDLLEDVDISKVFFDLRSDCDALFHQYHARPRNVLDCQIAFMKAPEQRRSRFNIGFRKALLATEVLTAKKREKMASIKEAGCKLFAPELGGSYEVFDMRPLPPELLDYLVTDVVVLLDLLDEQLRLSGLSMHMLGKLSEARMNKTIDSPETPKGKQMAIKDF